MGNIYINWDKGAIDKLSSLRTPIYNFYIVRLIKCQHSTQKLDKMYLFNRKEGTKCN